MASEKRRAQWRAYYLRNKAKCLGRQVAWREKNRDYIRAKDHERWINMGQEEKVKKFQCFAKWSQEHPDRVREYRRKWAKANYGRQRELLLDRTKQYYLKNRENMLKRKSAWERNRTARSRYSGLKSLAKRSSRPFNISLEAYEGLLKQPCLYCGRSIKGFGGHCLDRVDNSGGYVQGNVAPCCPDCNRIKCHLLTAEEMLAAMKAVKQVRLSKAMAGVPDVELDGIGIA